MRYWTGIGSRRTPKALVPTIKRIAEALHARGLRPRSGGSSGFDAFVEWASPGAADVYLPWPGFNGNPSRLVGATEEAFFIASGVHPAWENLTSGAKRHHARNVHQVLGKDCQTPSEVLVCWTPGGRPVGGSRTAIVLAEQHGIPVVNLFDDSPILGRDPLVEVLEAIRG